MVSYSHINAIWNGESILAAALDLYAEETCAKDEHGKVFKIQSQDVKIRNTITELLEDTLNADFDAATWMRNACKYGDNFMLIDHHPDYGVMGLFPLPVNEIEIERGHDKDDPLAYRYRWVSQGNRSLEKWQVINLKIPGNDQFFPYGASILEPARRVWRQMCHASNTKVYVDNVGWKFIKDVLPGDTVLSFDIDRRETKKTKVKAVKAMGRQNVIRVKTYHRSIDVTPNHGLLVYDPKVSDYEYKRADSLSFPSKSGGYASAMADKLVLPIDRDGDTNFFVDVNKIGNYYVKLKQKSSVDRVGITDKLKDVDSLTGHKNLHEFLQGNRKISIGDFFLLKKLIDVKPEECELYWHINRTPAIVQFDQNFNLFWKPKNILKFSKFFGFMLGDGWTKKGEIGFSTGVYEELNVEYMKLLLDEFGDGGKSITISSARKFSGGAARLRSQEAAMLMNESGFITGYANKRIPGWVYSLPVDCRIEFVKGLIDADGDDSGKIQLANENLILDLQYLCQITGIPVSGRHRCVKGKTKIIGGVTTNTKDSYVLKINLKKVEENSKYILENVLSIEYIGHDETYDLEVDDDTHNFTANGIISHNTLLEDAVMTYRIVRSPERRVFYIDVGGIAPQDVASYMEKAKTQLKRNQVADGSGRIDLRMNPMNSLEDYYIPQRGDQGGTRIETLPGGNFTRRY